MARYYVAKYCQWLTDGERQVVLHYMQTTEQGQILLVRKGQYLRVTMLDGATNEYQESGYHDYLQVELLPPPISLPTLDV